MCWSIKCRVPYWKGYLKLSLVSCPIALSPATSSSQRVSWRQINTKTGNRLRQQMVDDGSREPVDSEDRSRRYEIGKNEYLHVPDEELEAIALESTHTIEIDKFVPAAQIDKRYFDRAYYVSPNDKPGIGAFAVIRDAMRDGGARPGGDEQARARGRAGAARQGPARH
jgi:DNA end-binding protein Ku